MVPFRLLKILTWYVCLHVFMQFFMHLSLIHLSVIQTLVVLVIECPGRLEFIQEPGQIVCHELFSLI